MTGVLTGLVSALLADATIAAACGNRVLLLRAAATDLLPYVLIKPVSSIADVRCFDHTRLVTRNVQLWFAAVTATEALALSDAAATVLDAQTLDFSPDQCVAVERLGDDTPQQVAYTAGNVAAYLVISTYKVISMVGPAS